MLKRNKIKKSIGLMITTALTLGMLSGCGGKNSAASNDNVLAMGRYVESNVTLPDKIVNEEESLCKMETNAEGELVVYGFGEDLEKYTYKGNGKWECEALNIGDKILAECGEGSDISDIQTKDNGDMYLGINLYSEAENRPVLLKIDSSKALTSIPIEGWDKYELMDDYKYYPTVIKLAVLSDGRLLIGDEKGISLFDVDGKKIRDYGEAVGNVIVVQDDNSFITVNNNGNELFTYDIESGELKSQVAITDSQSTDNNVMTSYETSSVDVFQDNNGKLYLLNKDGVHTLADGGSIWETIIDGTLNSMSRQDQNFYDFTRTDDKFYLISMGSSARELLEYTYEENITSVPTNELSVYSLYNSATIRQAMVSFQQSHPDVKVNYRVAIGNEETGALDTTDYIKTLNTELLAGKGADIIILDGLDTKTYVEKGVLADISDIINPMEENNELLSNIADAYKQESGKIYSIPSKINIPIAAGDKEAIDKYGDLNKMTEYIKNNADASLLGSLSQGDLINNLYLLKANSLINEDNSINKEEMNLFLQNLKIIYDNSDIVTEEKAESIGDYGKLYTKSAKVVYSEITSLLDLMFFSGVFTDESTGYSMVNHLFKPVAELGINSAGQVVLAKEFIQEVLSEDIQKTDLGEGFPINANSLNEWIATEKKMGGSLGISVDDDVKIVEVNWPNNEERDKLAQMYRELTTPIGVNKNILDTISKECNTFLSGGESSDEATAKIIEASKVYLSE